MEKIIKNEIVPTYLQRIHNKAGTQGTVRINK